MGPVAWDHLVEVCAAKLQSDARLKLVDAADIHERLHAEVEYTRNPSYQQQLAQILLATGLHHGLADAALAQHQPRPFVIARPPPSLPPTKPPQPTSSLSVPSQPLVKPSSDAAASARPAALPPRRPSPQAQQPQEPPAKDPVRLQELRSPTGHLTEPQGGVSLSQLPHSSKPSAKPLIPGGPCENPFCGVVEAPQWRRIEKKLVCNRCGMYYHRHSRFPDWSYFKGLASKQALRHVVITHRNSSQEQSPASASAVPTGTGLLDLLQRKGTAVDHELSQKVLGTPVSQMDLATIRRLQALLAERASVRQQPGAGQQQQQQHQEEYYQGSQPQQRQRQLEAAPPSPKHGGSPDSPSSDSTFARAGDGSGAATLGPAGAASGPHAAAVSQPGRPPLDDRADGDLGSGSDHSAAVARILQGGSGGCGASDYDRQQQSQQRQQHQPQQQAVAEPLHGQIRSSGAVDQGPCSQLGLLSTTTGSGSSGGGAGAGGNGGARVADERSSPGSGAAAVQGRAAEEGVDVHAAKRLRTSQGQMQQPQEEDASGDARTMWLEKAASVDDASLAHLQHQHRLLQRRLRLQMEAEALRLQQLYPRQPVTLSPVLAAMLQQERAVDQAIRTALAAQELRQQQQSEHSRHRLAPHQQQQRAVAEEEGRAAPRQAACMAVGPRSGPSLLETIAAAAALQQQQHREQQQQHAPSSVRESGGEHDEGLQQQQQPSLRVRQMQAALAAAAAQQQQVAERSQMPDDGVYAHLPYGLAIAAASLGVGAGDGGGGLLMRDLQQRALQAQQQQPQQEPLHGAAEVAAPRRHPRTADALLFASSCGATLPYESLLLASAKGLSSGAAAAALGRGSSGNDQQQLPQQHQQQHQPGLYGLGYDAEVASVSHHMGNVGGGSGSGGAPFMEDLLGMLLARGHGAGRGGVKAAQPMSDGVAGIAGVSYPPGGALKGARQASGGSAAGPAGLLPVLDLGKPSAAMAF